MNERPKLWAGLYGAAFHVVVAAGVAGVALRNEANIPPSFYAMTVPPLLLAAFLVYAFVVGAYLPRRPTTRGAVFLDSAVGMMAEIAVITLAGILYGALVTVIAPPEGAPGFFAAFGNAAFVAVFWALSEVFTHVLVIGNAAGLVGYVLLKKLAERRARAAAA